MAAATALTAAPTSRRGLLVVTALAVLSFGPYIGAGLRTEQLAVYATAAVCLALALPALRPTHSVATVLLVWAVYAITAAVGAWWPPMNQTTWRAGSATAGMDNLLLPVAVVVIVLALVAWGADPRQLVRRVAAVTIALSLANTLAARAQAGGRDWSAFWSSDEGSVALKAATNGRFTGLVNQPAEAGLIYGIALLAVLYLLPHRPRWMLVLAGLTIYGGTMTVSKVFLLGALPIAAWIMFRMTERRAERVGLGVATVVAFYLLLRANLLPVFAGADQLRKLLPGIGQESFLQRVTAGRFGETSTLRPLASAVLDHEPVFGFGAGGLAVPYDNGWIEALVIAGLVGVACYTLTLVVIGHAWLRAPRSPERTFLGSLLALMTIASFGLPALTANRAATLLWLLLAALLLAVARQSPVAEDSAPERAASSSPTRSRRASISR